MDDKRVYETTVSEFLNIENFELLKNNHIFPQNIKGNFRFFLSQVTCAITISVVYVYKYEEDI